LKFFQATEGNNLGSRKAVYIRNARGAAARRM
jgi:hypothetical protein